MKPTDYIEFDEEEEKPVGRTRGIGELAIERFRSLQTLEPSTKASNYFQEVVEEYLPYIGWDSKSIEKDMPAFYVCAWRCQDRKGIGVLKDRLEWVRKKNCLFPGQVMKLLNKK